MWVERTVRGWPAIVSRARICTAGLPATVVGAVLISLNVLSCLRAAASRPSRAAFRSDFVSGRRSVRGKRQTATVEVPAWTVATSDPEPSATLQPSGGVKRIPCWGYDPPAFGTAAGVEVVGEESPPQPAARPATAVASMARVNERRMTADRGT